MMETMTMDTIMMRMMTMMITDEEDDNNSDEDDDDDDDDDEEEEEEEEDGYRRQGYLCNTTPYTNSMARKRSTVVKWQPDPWRQQVETMTCSVQDHCFRLSFPEVELASCGG